MTTEIRQQVMNLLMTEDADYIWNNYIANDSELKPAILEILNE